MIDDEDERVPRSNYITAEGAIKLRAELDQLLTVERPRVTQQVSEAAAQGDRSENAEYIYGKKRLREIDRRLEWLTKRLDQLKIVSDVPTEQDKVFFGAWVRLADEDDHEVEYRIVGPDETDTKNRWISMDSPLGRALLRKEIGDEVTVQRPKGEAVFEIISIRYH